MKGEEGKRGPGGPNASSALPCSVLWDFWCGQQNRQNLWRPYYCLAKLSMGISKSRPGGQCLGTVDLWLPSTEERGDP